jgi:DNA-binding response OmpR family regulator
MLLDVKVPHLNGFEFLKSLRDKGQEIPAIFITSLNSVEDVEKGFEVGCDDYIRKPFALKELFVRVESLLKRQYGSHSDTIKINENLKFDLHNLSLLENDKEIKLKSKELKLLKLFLINPNRTIDKQEIFETLWDYNEEPNEGSLRTYIKVIRSHIGKDSIDTIKNIGYRYVKK